MSHIVQSNTNLCWATSVTMLLSWAHQQGFIEDNPYDANVIFRNHSVLRQPYNENRGLQLEELAQLRSLGLDVITLNELPDVEKIYLVLRDIGPFVVGLDIDQNPGSRRISRHMLMVTGIETDGSRLNTTVFVNDPLDQSRSNYSFNEFVNMIEQAVLEDGTVPVVAFPPQ